MSAPIIVDDVRVRGVGKSFDSLGPSVWTEVRELEGRSGGGFKAISREVGAEGGKCEEEASTYFEEGGRRDVPVYMLERLEAGDLVEGPGAFFFLLLLPQVDIDISSPSLFRLVCAQPSSSTALRRSSSPPTLARR